MIPTDRDCGLAEWINWVAGLKALSMELLSKTAADISPISLLFKNG